MVLLFLTTLPRTFFVPLTAGSMRSFCKHKEGHISKLINAKDNRVHSAKVYLLAGKYERHNLKLV